MTGNVELVPGARLHNLRRNRVLQERVVGARRPRLARRRNRLFILMSNVVLDATECFRIPSHRVVELGGQIEIQPACFFLQVLFAGAAACTEWPTNGDLTADRVWPNTTGGCRIATAADDGFGNRTTAPCSTSRAMAIC